MPIISIPDINKSARNKQEQGRKETATLCNVSPKWLSDGWWYGWLGKKVNLKVLLASHLANLPEDIAVQWHWIGTCFGSCYQKRLFTPLMKWGFWNLYCDLHLRDSLVLCSLLPPVCHGWEILSQDSLGWERYVKLSPAVTLHCQAQH